MIASHEQKIRKILNLRVDDKPPGWGEKPWPPPIPADLVTLIDSMEQATRNHRGTGHVSVEIGWDSLIVAVCLWRHTHAKAATGTVAPPSSAPDQVDSDTSLMALRVKLCQKTGMTIEEAKKKNRQQVEAMLNG